MLIKELENEAYTMDQNASKFCKISGFTKVIFNEEKLVYLGCPDCRRKVMDEPGQKDVWKCETCMKSHKHVVPTYMISAIIHDTSGDVIVQFPRELGDPVMNGRSAKEYRELKTENYDDEKKFVKIFMQ